MKKTLIVTRLKPGEREAGAVRREKQRIHHIEKVHRWPVDQRIEHMACAPVALVVEKRPSRQNKCCRLLENAGIAADSLSAKAIVCAVRSVARPNATVARCKGSRALGQR